MKNIHTMVNKKILRLFFSALTVYSAIMLAGCSTIEPDPYFGDKRVSFDNLSPSEFKIIDISVSTNENTNRKEAKVTIENRSTSITDSLHSDNICSIISYRFVWFDQDGNPIQENNPSILPLTTKVGDKIIFSGIAPNGFCEKFCLKLKSIEE